MQDDTYNIHCLLAKHPTRVPVWIEGYKGEIQIDRNKYLIEKDMMISNVIYIIRQRIKLSSKKAMFVFINNTIPPTSMTIGQLYSNEKSDNGMLYITYKCENTFG